jgi:hypothetical protein
VDAPLGCIPKSLPPHLQFEAAWRSVLANADNLPRLAAGHLVMAEAPQIPGEMAIARGKYWPNGSKVAVEFWGGSTEVQDRVMAHANAWAAYANLDFLAVNRGRGQIRVSFDQPGYWSYIGTDCLSVSPGEPTLNLQGFDQLNMPESEWHRVVRHEVGHALGALHEQQRPEVVARLDPAKVIAAFQRSQGWSEQEIRDQILTPFDLSATEHTDEDDRSIMMYFFDGSLTVDGQPIVGGSDIDDRDKLLISQVYPGRWTPGTTPPVTLPAPPPDLPAIVVGDENGVRGTIPRGKSARFLLHKDKAVPLTIEAVVRGAGSRKPIVRMGLPGGASTLLKLTGSEARNVKAPVGDYEVRVSHPIAGHSGPCWVAARYS